MKKLKRILAVSFGTAHRDTREKTIGAIEQSLREAFPAYDVRRCFTSQTVIRMIREREGVSIPSVREALEACVREHIREVRIVPILFTDGIEYEKMLREAEGFQGQFDSLQIGAPLAGCDVKEDVDALARILIECAAAYLDGTNAVCFVGHGTDVRANIVYGQLQKRFDQMGAHDCFVGTVERRPGAKEILSAVQERGYESAVIWPLMISAGNHAVRDLFGDGEETWKSVFSRAGMEVVCVRKGLGEIRQVREQIVRHAKTPEMEPLYFPMFVNLSGQNIVVFGAGTIAVRRIGTLLRFVEHVTVVAPEAAKEVRLWQETGKVTWHKDVYRESYLDGARIVLGATDDHACNEQIARDCRARGICVNVCDRKELCDFYFPSVVVDDEIVIGINAGGRDHRKVKDTRKRIEKIMD